MASLIPYTAQVTAHLVRTAAGDYVQVIRLGGVSWETADDEAINQWHERLNVLWRNLASPHWALWSHIVRRRDTAPIERGSGRDFAGQLAQRYADRLARETLMANELYLSTVYRPAAGVASGLAARFLARSQKGSERLELADAVDACEKLARTLLASVDRYDPERLGTYSAGGRTYSRVLEFLSLLVNGERQPVPLPRAPLNEVLATTRVLVGSEAIEYRMPSRTRLGAVLGIKEYPTPSVAGMFDRLLSVPFAFVLTQSFAFLTKSAGQGLLLRQYNRMTNAGDFALSQAEELKDALDALTSNAFVMGDHHFTLQVLADGPQGEGSEAVQHRMRQLNEHVALARSMLADTGMTVAREDLALEAAYLAQLPGHFGLRPRRSPITSRNFAAMVPFHNFPAGRADGNHWGPALVTLKTRAGSAYHFSLHAAGAEADGGARGDTGHTFICGPTGSGKSVLIGFLIARLSERGVTQVVIDKDRGLEILVRALGGEYQRLANGAPTGLNPLQLPLTAANLEFLKGWLRVLVRRGADIPLTVREEADLDQALHGTLALMPAARRLSRLIEFLDATDAEGVHARLSRWCASMGGDEAWVFDNEADSVVPRLAAQSIIGFDVTEFLENPRTRAAVTLYLFHLVRQLLDGRRLVCWMDEFWRLIADPAFSAFAKDGPKTWRKLNGVMALATQSASDVLDSPISRTIVEQTPTKVFFPNVDAAEADYVGGFGLTQREFELVRTELEPGSRQFLVKQGHQSVVCELDLKGFEGELAVISGRAASLERLHRIMAETGEAPERWLPSFLAGAGESSAASSSASGHEREGRS